MQQVLDLIKSRRSIRKFKSDAVPSDLVDKVVEAGLYAATVRTDSLVRSLLSLMKI